MPMNLNLSETKDFFEYNGKKFFYCADTVWGAFTNVATDEWEEYLDYRRAQGFNVLQINTLRQWDCGDECILRHPFKFKPDGSYDFYSIDETYFENAKEMLRMAEARGFIPALVVLWGSYVPDTWMARKNFGIVMPFDAVRPYTEYVVKAFSEFRPVYFISGDTDCGSEMTVKYYAEAANTIRRLSPDAIMTMHLWGDGTEIPGELDEVGLLDFYIYQSGHRVEDQSNTYKYAARMMEKPLKRPIINSEPCYEGSGYVNKYGRFNESDIRKATWQSLLSGGKAGIAYGAHGMWSWHTKGKTTKWDEVIDTCFSWRVALKLPGAWDVSFAKWIFETYNLFDIEPANDRVIHKSDEIRASLSGDMKKFVLYMPYNTEVKVNIDLSTYQLVSINLQQKCMIIPQISTCGDYSMIKVNDCNSDLLLIGVIS